MTSRIRIAFRPVLLLATIAALAAPLCAQSKFEFWPGASYDPRIPAFKEVLGHDPGERITSHAGLMRYMGALANAAPDRMKIFEYAKTWEGRKLIYAAISSEANIKQLDSIRAGMQRLADPRRTPAGEARALMSQTPAVIWLGYGVHGNEISSPDAALLTAYHLLAARNDKMVEEILSKVVVLIDPTQNPDGRDRFVHNFEIAEGLEPDGSQLAAEHNEPWPGGRTNHYYFDMNRDWFALTQPETRGRVRALLEWYPLVFADLHEMGSDSTYYFAPDAVPFNPHLAKNQKENQYLFGKNNAKWFDQFGFSYFVGEVYDAFYPGYGASWPSYYGSIAMTYEQASVRGLVVRRSDQTEMHFRDSVRHHFVASLSTAETAARNREKLLNDFYRYRQTAIEEGSTDNIREYILPRRGDTSTLDKLAVILHQQGIEIKRANAPVRACGAEYPAGSYIITLAQPSKRLIRTLLDANVPMEEGFIKEQERRRKKNLPDEIYDVTAWSLPLMYNVEAIPCSEAYRGDHDPFTPSLVPRGKVTGSATVAYLAPWGTAAAGRLLAASLREGLRVFSTDRPFTQQGRTFPTGTLIYKVKENPANLRETLERVAAASGAEVIATDSGWVDSGVNFGSRNVVFMRRPTIAMAWDSPTSSASAGATRYVLERQFGYPVTVIRTQQLAGADLSRFHVLILPDAGFGGGYASILGAQGISRLRDWVSMGGTLIGLGGGAVSFLADGRTNLLAVSQESQARAAGPARESAGPRETGTAAGGDGQARATQAGEGRAPGKLLATEEDYNRAIQADSEPPDTVPGVLLKARLDADHWITAGLAGPVHALVAGQAIYSPIKIDRGVNAAVYPGPDQLLASGYLWEENRKQLAYKPLLVVQPQGRGFVIGFTADPNYRAYLDGLNVLFLNAIFRGAAHARPASTN